MCKSMCNSCLTMTDHNWPIRLSDILSHCTDEVERAILELLHGDCLPPSWRSVESVSSGVIKNGWLGNPWFLNGACNGNIIYRIYTVLVNGCFFCGFSSKPRLKKLGGYTPQYWVPSPRYWAWQPLRNLRWLHHRQIACGSTVGATARAKNVPKKPWRNGQKGQVPICALIIINNH